MALKYEDYPKWLQHPQGDGQRFTPVLVYAAVQEEEYRSKGYEPPGKADPHAFLLAKATVKLDDAIRSLNARVDKRLDEGLGGIVAKMHETLELRVDRLKELLLSAIDAEAAEIQARQHLSEMDADEPHVDEPPPPQSPIIERFTQIFENWKKLREDG